MKTSITAAVALLILASCSKKDETPAVPALAALTADFTLPANAESQTVLSFGNLSQQATRYKWTFGDGSAATTDASPQHRFAARGTFPITLTAYRNADSVAVTKSLRVRLYDQFAHAGIPTTSTYLTHGRREERFITSGSGSGSYQLTALPDLPMSIVRISPDSIRVNGILGLSMSGSTQFKMSGFSGSDASILDIYIPGDSVVLKEYSHIGHSYFKTDTHAGPRLR